MATVTSKDGTRIGYDKYGDGKAPAIILITGALGVRSEPMKNDLAALLATHFTVYDYDRRGRGESGDSKPYAVAREIEDIEALIDLAGGSAALYGMSSGAVLALDAANKLPNKVTKLIMYEPPFIIDDSRPPAPVDYVDQLNAAIAKGDRGGAVEIFMSKALLIPAEFVAQMRTAPMSESFSESDGAMPPEWAQMEKVAHTLAYDGTILQGLMLGKPLPTDRWTAVTAPTLVITGELTEPFFHDGAKALIQQLPDARHHLLAGQSHAVMSDVLAPVMIEFLKF
ncbi:MAG: alpha/beta hydrolase [Anaerolineae bacterium]